MEAYINTLAAMLNDADEEAIDRCEAMYVAKFRCEQARSVADVFGSGWEAEDAFYNHFDCEFDASLMIVELCNYKGEGEGFALWEDAKHLPVFKSKNDSRNLFGA
jgi:hypothetical protein